jgi:hypothetical protein
MQHSHSLITNLTTPGDSTLAHGLPAAMDLDTPFCATRVFDESCLLDVPQDISFTSISDVVEDALLDIPLDISQPFIQEDSYDELPYTPERQRRGWISAMEFVAVAPAPAAPDVASGSELLSPSSWSGAPTSTATSASGSTLTPATTLPASSPVDWPMKDASPLPLSPPRYPPSFNLPPMSEGFAAFMAGASLSTSLSPLTNWIGPKSRETQVACDKVV